MSAKRPSTYGRIASRSNAPAQIRTHFDKAAECFKELKDSFLAEDAIATLCRRVTEAEDAVLGALEPAERVALRRLLWKAAGGPGMAEVADPCEVEVS